MSGHSLISPPNGERSREGTSQIPISIATQPSGTESRKLIVSTMPKLFLLVPLTQAPIAFNPDRPYLPSSSGKKFISHLKRTDHQAQALFSQDELGIVQEGVLHRIHLAYPNPAPRGSSAGLQFNSFQFSDRAPSSQPFISSPSIDPTRLTTTV